MFPRTAPSRYSAENECVRFSDPVWVSSNFVEKATPELVCFIRKVKESTGYQFQARWIQPWFEGVEELFYDIYISSPNTAWKSAFPCHSWWIFTKRKINQRGYTFILELKARKQASARFVVLVDYQLHNQRLVDTPTVTVIDIGRQLYLANAVRLAEHPTARSEYAPCDLLDDYGRAIPITDIVRVH